MGGIFRISLVSVTWTIGKEMKIIQIPDGQNQDLRFAAESIQRIASDAIKAIENLYAQKSPTEPGPQNIEILEPCTRQDMWEEVRYSGTEIVKTPQVQPKPIKKDEGYQGRSHKERAPLIDPNLHNLNL